MLTAGMLAGYGIAMPVGAIALLIMGVSMRSGLAFGLSAGAGAATADLVYATAAAVAGSAVAETLQRWDGSFRLGSAVILVLIAAWGLAGARRSIQSDGQVIAPSGRNPLATFCRFVALTILNPLTLVYFTTLVTGSGVGRPRGPGQVAIFAFGAFVASLSWQSLLAAMGALGRRGLSPRARVGVVVIGNSIILGMAASMVINR